MQTSNSPEEPVLLIVALSPTDCTPTAMAIQAHTPDKVVILRTRFTRDDGNISQSEKRLESWLDGPDSLVSTFEGLKDPFPIPITKPVGFVHDNPTFETEWVSCHVDEIFSIIGDYCENWTGEVRMDILPGAKNPLISSLLGLSSSRYSLWYTLEDGHAVDLGSNSEEIIVRGGFLPIVDRAWLSGFPVHSDEEITEPPNADVLQFYKDVTSNLQLEFPTSDVIKIHRKSFNIPYSMTPDEFSSGMKELGHHVSVEERADLDPQASGEYLLISKGEISEEFHTKFMPPIRQTASPGWWLEPIVEAYLWNYWKPISTVNNMSVIHPTPDERTRAFERQWKMCYDSFHKGGGGGRAEVYSKACERLSLSTECKFTEFLQHEINFMKSIEDPELLLRYVRMVEIDTLMLDRIGVSSFDSKVMIRAGNPRESRQFLQKKSMQLAKWMKGGQHIVTTSSLPPLTFLSSNSVIHLQRLHCGREMLSHKERALPLPTPELYIELTNTDWRGGEPGSFSVWNFSFDYFPPSRMTNLGNGKNPEYGAVLCKSKHEQAVMFDIQRHGYVHSMVRALVMDLDGENQEIDLATLLGFNFEYGIKVGFIGPSGNNISPTLPRMGTILSYATLEGSRYNISPDSMLRLFTSLGLEQKAASTLFLDVNLELPGLDIFEWYEQAEEEKQRIAEAEKEKQKNDLKLIEHWILQKLVKIGKPINSAQLGRFWIEDGMRAKFDEKKLQQALKQRGTNLTMFLRELHEEGKLSAEIIPSEGHSRTIIQMK